MDQLLFMSTSVMDRRDHAITLAFREPDTWITGGRVAIWIGGAALLPLYQHKLQSQKNNYSSRYFQNMTFQRRL